MESIDALAGAELLDKPFKREAMARAVRAALQRGQ